MCRVSIIFVQNRIMNRILLATDFSAHAAEALLYSIALGHASNATIYVVHNYQTSSRVDTSMNLNSRIRENLIEEINQWISETVGDRMVNNVSLIPKAIKGKQAPTFNRLAEINNIDLIIMGAKGQQDKEQESVGKFAGKMLKNTKYPLILVPQGTVADAPKKILFAYRNVTNKILNTLTPLMAVMNMTGAGLSTVHILCDVEDVESIDLQNVFQTVQIPHSKLKAKNVIEGANQIILAEDLDMLCVIKRDRGIFEKIFSANTISREVLHFDKPLLILPEISG